LVKGIDEFFPWLLLHQIGSGSAEIDFIIPAGFLEIVDELSLEHFAQDFDRQKEIRPGFNPVLTGFVQASAGDHAVQVWMKQQVSTHECRTAVKPISAPRCFGSAAIFISFFEADSKSKSYNNFLLYKTRVSSRSAR
jgi:hypothetical protein